MTTKVWLVLVLGVMLLGGHVPGMRELRTPDSESGSGSGKGAGRIALLPKRAET